ncbi:MAG: SMC family ATPase, partial [Dehalococcoidia bacterium]|nr:SMC family ATPase [Dehalococcoidia bacterium]
MIPVSLRLKNFMSYREGVAPLDFTQFHLACLSGENGHGKSTLLDAITWAVWGKARATSDDQLIALGADHMEVEFVFQVGEARYRVLRKRSRRGKTTVASVDLFLCGPNGDIPRGGASARETNAIIAKLIGLDYDTFVRSSFLQQGQADKFTKEPPARRKELLATILGLDVYDWLERRAKERAREVETRVRLIEMDLDRVDQEIARKPDYEERLGRAIKALEALEQEQSARDAKIAQLQQQRAVLEKDVERAEALTRTRDGERDRYATTIKRAEAIATRIQRFEAAIAERDAIIDGFAVLQAARAVVAEQQGRATTLVALQRQRAALERTIVTERGRLERDRDRLASEIDQARRAADQAQRDAQMRQAAAEQAHRAAHARAEAEARFRALEEEQRRLRNG